MMIKNRKKKAAHFLLISELLYSPPNNAIINAYLDRGYEVDIFAPRVINQSTSYGSLVRVFEVSYSWSWLLRNLVDINWFRYSCISGTSEDPLAFVGILSFIYRIKSFCLVDEIKSGTYRGNRSEKWKAVCKWAIRRSAFQIVNDSHRVHLLQEYAGLHTDKKILIYPGCFHKKPTNRLHDRYDIRKYWAIPESSFVIGSSGGFNMTAGADWLLNLLKDCSDVYAVIQPLGISQLEMFLLSSLIVSDRIFVEKRRLGWDEAWIAAQGLDVGICIYTNPAPQFQKMGISSNRLCMFIAMGVPVIASRQESFQFLETYDCGILVGSYVEFIDAVSKVKERQETMKRNCRICFDNYIKPADRYNLLSNAINSLQAD